MPHGVGMTLFLEGNLISAFQDACMLRWGNGLTSLLTGTSVLKFKQSYLPTLLQYAEEGIQFSSCMLVAFGIASVTAERQGEYSIFILNAGTRSDRLPVVRVHNLKDHTTAGEQATSWARSRRCEDDHPSLYRSDTSGQQRSKPLPVDHTADPQERISAWGGEIGIFLVENEVPERTHIKRSMDKGKLGLIDILLMFMKLLHKFLVDFQILKSLIYHPYWSDMYKPDLDCFLKCK